MFSCEPRRTHISTAAGGQQTVKHYYLPHIFVGRSLYRAATFICARNGLPPPTRGHRPMNRHIYIDTHTGTHIHLLAATSHLFDILNECTHKHLPYSTACNTHTHSHTCDAANFQWAFPIRLLTSIRRRRRHTQHRRTTACMPHMSMEIRCVKLNIVAK